VRGTGAFVAHRFDDAYRDLAGSRPRSQEHLGERQGFFQGTQRTLHARIIMTYALVEA
jgi:hypothetical protein